MNEKTGTHWRIRNSRVLLFGRLLLLVVSWSLGLYLFFGRVEPFSGTFLLLAGIWLVLDNPLESFAVLSGPCPACGAEATTKRRPSFRCPACGATITVDKDRFSLHGIPLTRDLEAEAGAENGSPFPMPLHLPPGDTLDLHTFSPREVTPLLRDFVDLCEQSGISRARIIHGKGRGVLRRRVRALLARDPRVAAICDAPSDAGGWGATVVTLRSRSDEEKGNRGPSRKEG
jgi:hypothetical protein